MSEPTPTERASNSAASSRSLKSTVIWLGALAVTVALGYFAGTYAVNNVPAVKNVVTAVQNKFRPAPEVAAVSGPRTRVTLRGDEPTKGPSDALVTIIEFSDYECPFCVRLEEPLHEAYEKYTDKARLIFKHYPLPMHPQALPAAKVAEAANLQGKFWETSSWLFENRGNFSTLSDFAKEVGLDETKLRADMASESVAANVDKDRLAGGLAHIRGTPTLVINGHLYNVPPHAGSIAQAIEHELKTAEAEVAAGTSRDQVLEKLLTRDAAPAAAAGVSSKPAQ
jgi:protein-disulfide isomerase